MLILGNCSVSILSDPNLHPLIVGVGPFKQTERGKSQGSTGSGLGLSLVRGIVKQMGGRTGVRSVKGVGSTFWVELPLGVGMQTLLGHDSHPEGAEKSVRSAMHKRQTLSLDAMSLGMAVDEAAALNAVVPPKTPTTLGSQIMEQGEPVERGTGSIPSHSPTNTMSSRGLPTSRSMPENDPFALSFGVASPQVLEGLPSTSTIRPSSMISTDQRHFSTPSQGSIQEFFGLPVLVVDDDSITRMLMRRMLERNGCVVSEAENGQVASQMILGSRYEFVQGIGGSVNFRLVDDTTAATTATGVLEVPQYALVFLDNQMPVMSGLMTVKTLRKLHRREYVVGLTGNALQTDQDEFLEAGVDMYVFFFKHPARPILVLTYVPLYRVLTKPVKEIAIKNAVRVAHTRWKRTSQSGGPL